MNENQTTESKQVLSSNQKQSLKKYAAFSLMFIVFAACMWLIFAPSDDKKAKTEISEGLNVNLPAPKAQAIIGDKKAAYEEEQQKEKQTEKMRSLQDFATILGKEKATSETELSLADDKRKVFQKTTLTQITRKPVSKNESSIQNSVSAYRDINRTLGSFYEATKTDPEKERLSKKLEELKAKLAENENRKSSVDEQMAVMEKSYQIAAKYLPQMQGQTSVQQSPEKPLPVANKPNVIPVATVSEQVVSALRQNSPLQEPDAVFYTVSDGKAQQAITNTISACVHNDQTITDGQTVRLRLMKPFKVGTIIIPANEIISGMARIQGERLTISVTSLEYDGLILPVNLIVYDTDGQRGICIPNTGAVNAAKEIVANMGTSAGTSINLSSNAGQQLVADLGRSAIQGTSQYMAKKLREVKINLKAGYQVLLLPGNN